MSEEKLVDLDNNECKYCHEAEGSMIKPCNCNQFVHYSCLEKWQKSRHGNKEICEVCRTPYYGVTIFDGKKCFSELCFYSVIIIINIFVIIGCSGYDIIRRAFVNDKNTDFETLVFVMSWLAFLFMAMTMMIFTKKFNDTYNLKTKTIGYLLFNIGSQITAVTICSLFLKRIFWNISTYAMGTIIGLGVLVIFHIIKDIVKKVHSTYSITLYTNKPDQKSDQSI